MNNNKLCTTKHTHRKEIITHVNKLGVLETSRMSYEYIPLITLHRWQKEKKMLITLFNILSYTL